MYVLQPLLVRFLLYWYFYSLIVLRPSSIFASKTQFEEEVFNLLGDVHVMSHERAETLYLLCLNMLISDLE